MAKTASLKFLSKGYLKKRFVSWLQEENFHPTFLGILTNPFYIARKGLALKIKQKSEFLQGDILDIGCGQKPYKRFFRTSDYIGLELDTPDNRTFKQADYFYNGVKMPFGDNQFDSILCNQVLEHVFDPELFLKEVYRVVKPGGTVMFTVPFMWDEHEKPHDYARYTSFALKYLFEKNKFKVVDASKTVSNLGAIFQLVNAYLYKKLFTKNGKVNLLLSSLLCAPLTILGILFGKLFPDNEDLYLDNIIIAKKVEHE